MQPDPAALVLVGAVLVSVGLACAPLALYLAQRVVRRRALVPAGWSLAHVGLVALSLLTLQLAVAYFVVPSTEPGHVRSALLWTAAADVAGAALACAWAARTSPSPRAALGLELAGLPRALGAAGILYLALIPALLGLDMLWPVVLRALGASETMQPISRLMLDLPATERPLVMVIGILVVPACEELLFRGFLQPALERHLRPLVAVLATALLFAALHGYEAFLPIAALSVVLGLVRQRTGSLLASWVLHALHNGITFLILWGAPETLRQLGGAGPGGWIG